MSMTSWGIVGYGVSIDDIYKYIDHEKVNAIIRKLFREEDFTEDVFEDDTFYGNPYTNFAEFLCELDDDNIFSWDDDGQDKDYFLYEPSFSWARRPNEPSSMVECQDKMVNILKKVCDVKDADIRACIRYISDGGFS